MSRDTLLAATGLLMILMAGAAQAATAGHLFKSTLLHAPQSQPETTGSISKPASANGDVTAAIRKPATGRIFRPKPAPAAN